jgi:2-polyprenyl-3-methyl-5-hydroxy-6-metoxy-1,4-benzoquinol methylase
MRDEGDLRMRALVSRQLRRLRRLVFPRLRKPDVLTGAEREAALEILYRLVLGRPVETGGREHYLRLMRRDGVSLRDIAVELAASDELQERLRRRATRRFFDPPSEPPDGFVDVREVIKTRTLTELNKAADEYYSGHEGGVERHHAKPLADIHDAPDLLGSFAQLLAGLALAPGMRVLDFGCGTGWRSLTQLGCAVTATDVSATALKLAEDLFVQLPPVGVWTRPRFVLFDGRHLDVASESLDRVVCVDALHHVPNPAEVLTELARVLRPGGIAAFREPGSTHSHSPHSQYEMKNYLVVENDIVLSEIQRWAMAAGFTRLEVAVFSTESYRIPLERFDDLVAGSAELDTYNDRLREYLSGHQMFFLHKGEEAGDSRHRDGLRAAIQVELEAR